MTEANEDYPSQDALEQMIDAHGLDAILITLSEICSKKAKQLRQNRQGDPSAELWDKAAVHLMTSAAHSAIREASHPPPLDG
jgi:hypothetical protein